MLNLVLCRRTVADNRLLDLSRRIFEDFDIQLKRGTQSCRTGMTQLQGAARISMDENAFDGNDVRPVLRNDLADRLKDELESVRKFTLGALHRATRHVSRVVGFEVKHTEAGQPRPRVNSENS